MINLEANYDVEDEDSENSTIDEDIVNKIFNKYENLQKKEIDKYLSVCVKLNLEKWSK